VTASNKRMHTLLCKLCQQIMTFWGGR